MLVIIILATGALQAALGILQYGIFEEYRAHGTFFNPNFFASYQAGIVVLAGSLLCFSGDLDISKGKRAALWALLIVSVVAFVLARSRGALLALVPVLFFIALMRFRRRAIPFLLCGLLAVIIIPNPIRARSLEVASQDHFAYTRLDIWKNAMARIADQPWGSGLGMYKYVSFKSRFPIEGELARYGRRAESAHNEYLQIASELGLAGLFIVLTGAVLWVKEVKHVCVDRARSARRAIMIGLAGIVSAILIHALVDSVLHEPALVLLLILAAAMVLAMGRMKCNEDSAQPQLVIGYTRCRALIGGLILSILLVLTVQPATAWYAFEQGNHALSSGDLRTSVRWYAVAIKIEPWNASYHNALASSEIALFQQSKDPDWIVDAVEEMKMCSTLNALDGRYPYRLGTLYQLLAETVDTSPEKSARRLAEATDSFRQAVIRDPYFPPSRVALGKIQRLDGELRQARTSFSEALELEPNYLPARALRIQVDMELGDSTLARNEYREMLTIAERWRGKATSALEMQFLDVDWDQLKRLVQS
jgi:O-antigen ligase